MNRIAARSLGYGAGLLLLTVFGWILTGHAAKPLKREISLPTDWSHYHVIYTQPASEEQARFIGEDPRYWQEVYRQGQSKVLSPEVSGLMADSSTPGTDWSQKLGPAAATPGRGNYPAKFSFSSAVANCGNAATPDYVKSQGLRVIFANVLMVQNLEDYPGVRALAKDLGIECTLDPTITPMMDGDRSILKLGVNHDALRQVFRDQALVGDVEEFCAVPAAADDNSLSALPCSAGHTTCYVSPYGDVFPCVSFPLPTGNVRNQRFLDIWRHSERMNEVRSIRLKDLTTCGSCAHFGSCSRCPGLAFMEGNMRGPSSQDCEKSFARTGIASANMLAKRPAAANLVQIQIAQTSSAAQASSAIA